VIPEWNDLVYRDDWRTALDQLHATNNFPEFTGRTCPAPCENACVLGINTPPVTIKGIENALVERGWQEGWIIPEPPAHSTGKRVAIVGSGPAGLAAAQQLRRAGHDVVVFERADRLGGLLVYGIPNFKLEKGAVERRIDQLRREGVDFRTRINIGIDINIHELRQQFDAVVLAIGSTVPRDIQIPGRQLHGIYPAMEYLTQQNRVDCGDSIDAHTRIHAAGKHVIVIGGGDTASDCIGTAHRQGALSVTQLDVYERGKELDTESNPWWPLNPALFGVFQESSSQQEGGTRLFTIVTEQFLGDAAGRVTALQAVKVGRLLRREERLHPHLLAGERITLPADLVLIAVGFQYPEYPLLKQCGVATTPSGTIAISTQTAWQPKTKTSPQAFATNVEGVFAAGDCTRGASLVVWAIAEGRNAARSVDEYLMGATSLPAPLEQTMVIDKFGVALY
jgi:glutamate synthase (NADPH/NADH) small chain